MKLRFAVACGLATLASGVSAQSSVTVYGLVDVGIEANSAGKGTNWREITGGSLGSRLGFRGVEDLGNGLSAVFRLEQGFSPDDGTLQQGGRMFGREASVGLSSKSAGTLSAGRIPTPLYNVAAYVDAFGWMGGGLVALTRSAAATTQVLPLLLNARSDNSVAYLSPKLGGLEVRAQGALGEGGTTLGRAYGFSGRYTGGALDLVAGYGRQNAGTTGTGKLKSYVVGGSFDFGAAKLFAGVSDDVNSCSNCTGALARPVGITATGDSETRLYNLGVRLPFGSTTAIVQYAHVDDRSEYLVNPGDRDANWVALGAEYALSKRTLIYSSISTINNKNGSQYNLGTSAAGQQPAATTLASNNARAKTAAIGVRHNF